MTVDWLLAIVAMLFGGFVKGVVGLGLPLVATPIVANALDPRTAVVVMVLPTGLTNLSVIFGTRMGRSEFRRIAGVFAGVILGTFGGARLLAALDVAKLSLYVGLVVIVFVLLQSVRLRVAIPPRAEPFAGPAFGFVAGLFGASTSLFGPLLTMYLYGIGLDKQAFVVAISTLFLIGNVGQVLAFTQLGLFTQHALLYSVALTVPAMLGVWLGARLQHRVDQRLFNRIVLIVMLASALSLVWRGLPS